MALTEDDKRTIDALSDKEMLMEITLGFNSHFQREKYAYLVTAYLLRKSNADDQHKKETVELAKEANAISNQALTISNNSNRIAWIAIVISLVAIIVQIEWKTVIAWFIS